MSRLELKQVRFSYPAPWKQWLGGGGTLIGEINLTLGHGFHLLAGPNGSGKSSLLKLIAGILVPAQGGISYTRGNVRYEHPILRRLIGYMPQTISVYEDMEVGKYLAYLSKLKCLQHKDMIERTEEVLEQTGLTGENRRLISMLSTGERRRLMLAQALLGRPQILLLDEPFSGVGIEERNDMIRLLSDMAMTRIIIAAHHLLDLDRALFDEMITMRAGQVLDICRCSAIQGGLEDYYLLLQGNRK